MTRLALAAVSLLSWIGAAAAVSPPTFSADLLRDRLWDDGKAEYSVYDALERREGIVRPARVVHIVVKERFNSALGVEADAPTGSEVLKMNQIIDVPTGVSAVHQMVSEFWDRPAGELRKISLSSIDSRGNIFKMGRLDGRSLVLTYHTYRDGEGDGVRDQRLPDGALFYDELPWKLRTMARPDAPASFDIELVPSLVGSRLGSIAPEKAKVVVAPPTKDKLRIDVVHGGSADRFVFDRSFPHVLRLWLRPDGGRLTLKKTQRLDYWNHTKPGDERLLE